MDFSWTGVNLTKLAVRGVGLKNKHNECFINAVLQFVFHTPQVFRYILWKHQNPKSACKECKQCVYCILWKYLDDIQRGVKVIKPTELLTMVNNHFPGRISGKQEDAHEMLIFLFDQFETPRPKSWDKPKKPSDMVKLLFEGKMESCLRCHSCDFYSQKQPETFRELSLYIGGKDETLKQHIDNHYRTTLLNDFKCEKCSEKTVYRKFFLVNAPNLLIIQLVRFRPNGSKRMKDIEIPMDLNLDEYFQRKPNGSPVTGNDYKLYGCINHLGSTIQRGHYTATFLGYDGEHWYLYDDVSVKTTRPETNPSGQPYMLFYYKTDAALPPKRRPLATISANMNFPSLPPNPVSDGKRPFSSTGPASASEDQSEKNDVVPEKIAKTENSENRPEGEEQGRF